MVNIVKYHQLLQDPAQHFESPDAVVNSETLGKTQKLEILKAWEDDEKQLQTAAAENMCGGERDILDRVLQAKIRLENILE